MPMEVGGCTDQIWRWYYDSKIGKCLQFSYSGCHGNNNNFATSKKCLWLCSTVGNYKFYHLPVLFNYFVCLN